MCKRVKSCDLMSVEGIKGKCGFCERLGYAVPANADGSDKYPEDTDGSCGQPTVMDASSCAKPLPVPLITSDGVECGNYGRPSADGSKRLYTRAECDALNGIYTPDGKCASRGGGSYSDMCRELNDPAQATPTVCTPNALGNLTRECLKSLALGLGYNKSGAIIRVLETGATPTETDRNARDVLRGAGIAIPDAVLGAGNIDTTSAGTVYQRIYNAMTGGATSMVREAAKWMVTGSNAFDVCDFGPTARGPFPLTCLQRAFRQAGCQPAGTQHPSEASAQRYASMTWGEVNGEFKQLYADMKSGDSGVQDKALTSCLGLKYAREPPKACPVWQSFDYLSQPNEPTLTYNELRDVCQRKGMKICSSRDLCKDGKPIADLDIFGSTDNWIAVSDKENEWFTYNRAGNRLCKTHTEVDGRLPFWGTTKNARGWARAVKCCANTYTTVKGGYPQTSGLQPSCFSGLSPEQAQEGCNKLGSRCGGFSYSVDGKGHGCYKGDVKGGFVNDRNYMGYVKST